MSVRFITIILRTLRLPPLAKLLLLAVADHGPKCFTSTRTLAKETGISHRNVIALLKMLCSAGLVKNTGKRTDRGTFIYEVQLDDDLEKKSALFETAQRQASDSNKEAHRLRAERQKAHHADAAASSPTDAAASSGVMQPRATNRCSGAHESGAAASPEVKTLSKDLSNGGRPNGNSVIVKRLSPNTPMSELALYAVEEAERTGVQGDVIIKQVRGGKYEPPPKRK